MQHNSYPGEGVWRALVWGTLGSNERLLCIRCCNSVADSACARMVQIVTHFRASMCNSWTYTLEAGQVRQAYAGSGLPSACGETRNPLEGCGEQQRVVAIGIQGNEQGFPGSRQHGRPRALLQFVHE